MKEQTYNLVDLTYSLDDKIQKDKIMGRYERLRLLVGINKIGEFNPQFVAPYQNNPLTLRKIEDKKKFKKAKVGKVEELIFENESNDIEKIAFEEWDSNERKNKLTIVKKYEFF